MSLLAVLTAATLQLPATSDKAPVAVEHFPSPLHAYVWRNWQLVPLEQMAAAIDTDAENLARVGKAMGLGNPPVIPEEVGRRAYISIIRRNWHLLPYPQLMKLLDVTEEELAFTLREDDFLYIKLGSLKPKCPPLSYTEPDEETRRREAVIWEQVEEWFPEGPAKLEEPLFHFIERLSAPLDAEPEPDRSRFHPRYCSSYFALFGDPLMEPDLDPFPEGYVQRLVASGVDSVWMHAVLYHLAPYPWDPALSAGYEQRLAALKALTERLAEHGVGLYLYMNEPRAMPLGFYDTRPELKGVVEGDHAALCTAVPEVRNYLRDSVQTILEAAPKLKGFFTITASENLTNCWSHHRGDGCPRCKDRSPAETVTGVTRAIQEGIAAAGTEPDLIAWDWGWQDAWALEAIAALPEEAALMSVSEWSIPINRGGVETAVGEYSISTIGPGPRATKHWAAARERGLRTVAKIQAGNTWELAAVPYIPATENVAQHAANLLESGVDGIMLGWSLGGYPSPNLAVVAAVAANAEAEGGVVDAALRQVAEVRYGDANAEAMVQAWKTASAGLREFPYHGGVVYRAPLQMGPANLLWAEPTGYTSTMVGLPYDDLKGWRAVYPEDVFIGQMEKVAAGFEAAYAELRKAGAGSEDAALARALSVIEASALHYRSVARQASFVQKRDVWLNEPTPMGALALLRLAEAEREAALRLHALQVRDSRLGYEASNHYFYVPLDLAEKALNCEWVRASIAHAGN